MSKLNKKEQVVLSLSNIKTELDKLGLWSNGMNRPDDSAFNTNTPFFMDTMEFHQWLEFVLFPRMMEIVNSDNPLPQKCSFTHMPKKYIEAGGKNIKIL